MFFSISCPRAKNVSIWFFKPKSLYFSFTFYNFLCDFQHLSCIYCGDQKVSHAQNLLTFVAVNALFLQGPWLVQTLESMSRSCGITLILGYPHSTFRWKGTANYGGKSWRIMIQIFKCFCTVFVTCNTLFPVVTRQQRWRGGPWSKPLIFCYNISLYTGSLSPFQNETW